MAQTCTNCGYFENSDTVASCAMCGSSFQQAPPPAPSRPTPPQDYQPPHPEIVPVRAQTDLRPRPDVVPVRAPRQDPGILEGRIILIQRVEERPPRNLYRSFSKTIILFVLSPIYISAFILSLSFFIAFAILRFSTIAQLFNPITWTGTFLELFEVLVLRRRGAPANLVVYRGMVRNDENRSYAFVMYGNLIAGNLIEGHRVRFSGDWRERRTDRGTFFVAEGHDLETGAQITTSHGNPWRAVFFILLITLLGLAVGGWYWAYAHFPGIAI